MAHFRAVIQGQRGEASRLGSKTSGITTRLQTWGWDLEVDATHKDGADLAHVVLVNHSSGQRVPLLDLDLSKGLGSVNIADVVTFIYRTVADKVDVAHGRVA